jgi:hypothetical protein
MYVQDNQKSKIYSYFIKKNLKKNFPETYGLFTSQVSPIGKV